MAIARLSVKVGKAGKAAVHAEYIARAGRYAGRLERGEKLEAVEAGNLPAWAAADPGQFWLAADANERANGTTYREFEAALPRELSPVQRADLVREFVTAEIGERHAYLWAIHTPKAADGGEQPHAHIMFSERQADGIERDPDAYFKRYNAKAPEKGGARKGYGPHAGQTLSAAKRAEDLRALRTRWESLTNAHLERAGWDERIDMRSHAARGIDREPERKQLPSAWRGEGRSNVIEFRAARIERDQAAADLRRLIPDPAAALADRQAQHDRLAALRAERLAAFIATKAEQEARANMPPVLDQAPTQRARGGRFQDFGTIPVKETTQERRERTRAEREAQRQARERKILEAIAPAQAPELRAKTVRELAKLREARADRIEQRIEAQQRRLADRREQHAREAPSKGLRVLGRYRAALDTWKAEGAAMDRRSADLDRRCMVARAAERAAPEWATARVVRELPRLDQIAEKELGERREKRLEEYRAKQARERGKGRSR